MCVAEPRRLGRSAGGEGFGEEEENDVFAEKIAEGDGFVAGGGDGEVGGGDACLEHGRSVVQAGFGAKKMKASFWGGAAKVVRDAIPNDKQAGN